jgi:predicted GNAT superfamily acetyltransferase
MIVHLFRSIVIRPGRGTALAHTGVVVTISAALVAEAEAVARAVAEGDGLRVVDLHEVVEHEAAVALLGGVWGVSSAEDLVNAALLRALAHSGNYVTGAYAGERLVGAAVAFFGAGHLHSHLTGVDRTAQARGVGYALKQHQRGWTLRHGLTRVCWTYDPLVRRNAHFNLHKLGATATGYLPDFYGALTDGINVGDTSDRLYVDWRLDSPAAVAAARGQPRTPSPADPYVLVDAVGDEPVVAGPPPDGAGALLVGVPEDIESLRRQAPETAGRWRFAVRDALVGAFERGYRVVGFSKDGRYVLEPGAG